MTGISGSGKTVALQSIEQDICQHCGIVLAFDFNGSHSVWFDNSCRKIENRISLKQEGLPFSFLHNNTIHQEIYIELLLHVFSSVARFGVQQEMQLYKALKVAQNYKLEQPDTADFLLLKIALVKIFGNAAYSIIAHMRTLFTVKTATNYAILPNRINILDFSGFDGTSQMQLANFCLTFIWQRLLTGNAQAIFPFFIVLDEFQNLDFSPKATLSSLLREGRKFNIHLLLATQSLSSFSKKERTILDQAATKLYLHPDDSDLRLLKNSLNGISSAAAEKALKSLPIGYCFANGTFDIGNQTIQKSLRIALGTKYRS